MSLSQGNITKSDGYKATYVASWAAFTPSQGFFTISGSATKTVKVLRIGFSGTQTAASTIIPVIAITDQIFAVGVSIAPTGIVPFDSTSPAATATPLVWTTSFAAGGTVGTYPASLKQDYVTIPVTTAITAAQNEYIFDFNTDFNQTMILSTALFLYIRLAAAPPAGLSLSLWIEWTEE